MKILLVGEMGGQTSVASQIAMQRGANVVLSNNVDMAFETLCSGQGIDFVMFDVKLSLSSFMEKIKLQGIHVIVLACGEENSASVAVAAIKEGAKEYIPLPPDPEFIAQILSSFTGGERQFLFQDPLMESCVKKVDLVAPSVASILLMGASGVGKEVMARYIHEKSKRNKGPFIAINCAAIPENLLETELFGHEKGAFTGALSRRIGKFEEANGGTLLLDEISEMDLRLQAKLLRVLQEREIDRLGGQKSIKVDIRVLATTNRDLYKEVVEKRFREDLYFRLNVVTVDIPSLRDRPLDIELLARYFMDKYAVLNDIKITELTKQGMQRLLDYSWPGNVRELENTMHRSVLLADSGVISAPSIVFSNKEWETKIGGSREDFAGKTLAQIEKDAIVSALNKTLGDRARAADILGISIRMLRNKLNKYGNQGMDIP